MAKEGVEFYVRQGDGFVPVVQQSLKEAKEKTGMVGSKTETKTETKAEVKLTEKSFGESFSENFFSPTGFSITTISALLLAYFGRRMVDSFFSRKRERDLDSENIKEIREKAEKDIVVILQEDNASLRKEIDDLRGKYELLSEERNKAVSQMGKILAELDSSRVKISELQEVVNSMSSKIDEQTKLLQSVLGENIKLKSHVENLEDMNGRLEKEVTNIESLVSKTQ